jgi:hypothetical protein
MIEGLPVRADLLHEELEAARKTLQYWEELVYKGIPGVDLPAADAEAVVDKFRRELCGELMIVAGKCQTLSMVISEG